MSKRPVLVVEPGDLAPSAHGMTFDDTFFSLDAQAGRPAALIFAGAAPELALARLLQAFERRHEEFRRVEADVVALIDILAPSATTPSAYPSPAVKKVLCGTEILKRWGAVDREPAVVVIDRGLRIMDAIEASDADLAADAALRRIAALPREAPCEVCLPAPVLAIPEILSSELCRDLIAHFEASPHQRGGMASRDAQGNSFHKIDESKKHRYDLVLAATDPLYGQALSRIARCVLPAVRRAFQVDIRHNDRILIARYDDGGGYFKRHRDNAAPGVEYRQFALSINLSDEYEGGRLAFPEYNSHRHKLAAGSGLVFSCSLLHEATPVTSGRRYVLLTFLHDAAAQARRMASAASTARRADYAGASA